MIQKNKDLLKEISHLDQATQDEIIKWAKPFFDFTEYMQSKFKKDFKTIENESSKYSTEVLPEYLKEIKKQDSPLEFIVAISSKIYKRYSESYGYDKSDELEISMKKYMELLLKYKLNGNTKRK